MDLKERKWEGVDWLDLCWSRDKWRSLVKEVKNAGYFLIV